MAPLVTKLVDEHVAVLADAKRARSVAWSVAWFSTAGFHQMPPALSDRMKTSASQGWLGEHGVGGHHQIAAMRTRRRGVSGVSAATVHELRGQPVSPPRDRGLRSPASPPARGGGEDIYSWRKAAAIGRRAARRAGNSPPRNPMTSAQRPPCTSSAGVTSKANATCENVCQLNVAVW